MGCTGPFVPFLSPSPFLLFFLLLFFLRPACRAKQWIGCMRRVHCVQVRSTGLGAGQRMDGRVLHTNGRRLPFFCPFPFWLSPVPLPRTRRWGTCILMPLARPPKDQKEVPGQVSKQPANQSDPRTRDTAVLQRRLCRPAPPPPSALIGWHLLVLLPKASRRCPV